MVNYKSKQYRIAGITKSTYKVKGFKRNRRLTTYRRLYHLDVAREGSSWVIHIPISKSVLAEVREYLATPNYGYRFGTIDDCDSLRRLVNTWIRHHATPEDHVDWDPSERTYIHTFFNAIKEHADYWSSHLSG